MDAQDVVIKKNDYLANTPDKLGSQKRIIENLKKNSFHYCSTKTCQRVESELSDIYFFLHRTAKMGTGSIHARLLSDHLNF